MSSRSSKLPDAHGDESATLQTRLEVADHGGSVGVAVPDPHRLFGPDAARRFADCYLHHLRLVADSRS